MNTNTNTDRAIRCLNIQKSTKAIANYRAALDGASDEEKAFLLKTIASHQAVIDLGYAMIEAGY